VRADDLGEFTHYEPTGVVVRYEASIRDGKLVATLHATVGGHTFGARVERLGTLDDAARFLSEHPQGYLVTRDKHLEALQKLLTSAAPLDGPDAPAL